MDSEEIKRTVSMQDVLAMYGMRANRAGQIICPFHDDRHPSMKIYKDGYKCFACGEYGDIFTFIMKMDGCDFPTAYQKLGGTYANYHGKTKNEIRQMQRDIMTGETKEDRAASLDPELDRQKKIVAVFKNGMQALEKGSREWHECQLNLMEERHKLDVLLHKREVMGNDRHSDADS